MAIMMMMMMTRGLDQHNTNNPHLLGNQSEVLPWLFGWNLLFCLVSQDKSESHDSKGRRHDGGHEGSHPHSQACASFNSRV